MRKRGILALDGLSLEKAILLTRQLGGRVYAVKIHALFITHGPAAVHELYGAGVERVWLDAKLHDTEDTVREEAAAIASIGVKILSVHASGGTDMMAAAVAAFPHEVFAVTVLTSQGDDSTRRVYRRSPLDEVLCLAPLAKLAGVAGVTCSPKEVGILARREEFRGLKFVVVGIRSAGKDAHNHQRVGTPGLALKDGASHIVIGREITLAKSPLRAFDELEAGLAGVL